MVGGAGHVDRHGELLRQSVEPTNVVGMLVRNDDGREGTRVLAAGFDATKSFTPGKAGVNQNASARTRHDGAVAFAAAGQHRTRNRHKRSIAGCGMQGE